LGATQEIIKDALRITGAYQVIRPYLQSRRYRLWIKNGRTGAAPDILKEETIRQYAKDRHARILVETGTYRGDTLAAVKGAFDELYSIELSQDLYRRALRRFRKEPKIHLLYGDSASVLPELLRSLTSPAVFWLDAHFSSGVTARGLLDTPIWSELSAILSHDVMGHTVLIDDARHFSPAYGYPSIEELEEHVHRLAPSRDIQVRDDIIRIV
jgi:hypothetical protein